MTKVVSLDTSDPSIKKSVLELLIGAFGSFEECNFDHILKTLPNRATLYGVLEGDDIVAINAFIAHSVQRGGKTGLAYQSCLSATRADQKGRGHFSRIIEFAKIDLAANGAAFIFGFPNHNSSPIFTRKLGFSCSSNVPCIYAPIPFLKVGKFDEHQLLDGLANDKRIFFDIYETADWKRSKLTADFFEIENLTNYLFGHVTYRRWKGIKLKLLVIGGYEINKPLRFESLMRQAISVSGARLIRFNANSAGPLAAASGLVRSESLTEPTIAYSLNWTVDAKDVEACGGLKDVY